MALTDAQRNAIKSSGNLIVSAGAGSGKTTVLTARVIDKIINEHVDISEFLIVTFTNAAAKQMREKIKGALLENDLDNLVNKVDSAHIETFDAFALYVVKKYGYLIGLPSTINNVPADVIQVKTHNIINDIFNRLYIWTNDKGQTVAYSVCYFSKNISHIAYVFYNPQYCHGNLPIRLVLQTIIDSHEKGLGFCYLGRFSNETGYYKRNMPGFEYFSSNNWVKYDK